MKKPYWIIIGGGLLVAIILLAIWLVTFLDMTPPNRQPVAESGNPTDEPAGAAVPQDDDQIRSNGRVMAPPTGVEDVIVGDPTLLRAATADSLPPGWQKTTWPEYLPEFNAGDISVIMTATDKNLGGWVAAIDNVVRAETEDYLRQLANDGWKVSPFDTGDATLFTAEGRKNDWQLNIIQNLEVRQVIISLSEINE